MPPKKRRAADNASSPATPLTLRRSSRAITPSRHLFDWLEDEERTSAADQPGSDDDDHRLPTLPLVCMVLLLFKFSHTLNRFAFGSLDMKTLKRRVANLPDQGESRRKSRRVANLPDQGASRRVANLPDQGASRRVANLADRGASARASKARARARARAALNQGLDTPYTSEELSELDAKGLPEPLSAEQKKIIMDRAHDNYHQPIVACCVCNQFCSFLKVLTCQTLNPELIAFI